MCRRCARGLDDVAPEHRIGSYVMARGIHANIREARQSEVSHGSDHGKMTMCPRYAMPSS